MNLEVLVSIISITPDAPKAGDPIKVQYELMNLTLRDLPGTLSGSFQGHPLRTASGTQPVQFNFAAGATLSGELDTIATSIGTNILSIRFADQSSCHSVPNQYGNAVSVCANAFGAGATAAVTVSSDPAKIDADNDGIPDQIEDALLARFRPFYRFSYDGAEEPDRPTDPIWYVRHSTLLTDGDQSSAPAVSDLSNPNSIFTTTAKSGSSSVAAAHCRETYFLNPDDHYRSGFYEGDGTDWPGVIQQGNIGLFGHVSRDPDLANTFRIEYWQFYGFNDANAPSWFGVLPPDLAALKAAAQIADHEGDWEGITVVATVDPQTGNPTASEVIHFVHGTPIRFSSIAVGSKTQIPGSSATGAPPSCEYILSDIGPEFIFHGTHWDSTFNDGLEVTDGGDLAKMQDAVLEMLCATLPNQSEYECTHPVVYVEWGTHASWPTPKWGYSGAPNHNGAGTHRYLTAPPPNLGEVTKPDARTPFSDVILCTMVTGVHSVTSTRRPRDPHSITPGTDPRRVSPTHSNVLSRKHRASRDARLRAWPKMVDDDALSRSPREAFDAAAVRRRELERWPRRRGPHHPGPLLPASPP